MSYTLPTIAASVINDSTLNLRITEVFVRVEVAGVETGAVLVDVKASGRVIADPVGIMRVSCTEQPAPSAADVLELRDAVAAQVRHTVREHLRDVDANPRT